MKTAVDFFDAQFGRQIAVGELALNPFEQRVLPYVTSGTVLDLGCGLGNFSLAAARQGARVTALDCSVQAVAHLQPAAAANALPLSAQVADLADLDQ